MRRFYIILSCLQNNNVCNNVVINEQFGFRPKYSIQAQLLRVSDTNEFES